MNRELSIKVIQVKFQLSIIESYITSIIGDRKTKVITNYTQNGKIKNNDTSNR